MTMLVGDGPVKRSDKPKEKQSASQLARKKTAEARALGKGSVVFQLTKGKTRTHIVKARCIAIEAGQLISLRYFRGISEILESKQKGLEGKTAKAIVFRMGKIVGSDEALKKYLRRHPDNVKNGGNVFYEYNVVQEADKNLKIELARDKAKFMAAQGVSDVVAYQLAKMIGIDNIDSLSDSEIRIFLRNYADHSPEDFNDMIESPQPEMNDVLAKAISSGLIVFSRDNKSLMYSGGGDIVALPALDRDGQIEHVIRWGLTDKLGEEFFDTLRKSKSKKK